MASRTAIGLDEILRTTRPVAVLTGSAACGKSASVLEFYRHFRDEIGQPKCLLIVPNAPAQSYLRSQLLASSSGVLVSPAITTFAGLAARVLAHAGVKARRLSGVQRHLLLERVVRDLHEQGRFKVLGALMDTPGLVAALDQSIAELKRSAIAPEDLQRVVHAADSRAGRPVRDTDAKNADLLAVYQAYQQHLLDEGRFDTEGLLWLARDVLAANPQAAIGWDAQFLAVDGFIDFTPTQLEVLALLSGRMQKTLITLPHAAEEQRRRLWQWTQRTLDQVQAKLDCDVLNVQGPDAMAGLFDLSVLTGDATARGTSPADAPELRVLSAGSIDAEVRAVAAAIKADLVGQGDSDRKCPRERGRGDTMAVLVRSLEGYEEPIRRIFAQYDIPISQRPGPLSDSPIIRFLLGVLSLPHRYLMSDVLSAIGNSYFDPGALGDFPASLAQVACMAIRCGNVLEGRQNYARAFERLVHLSQRDEQSDEEDGSARWPMLARSEPLQQASAMLEAVFDLLDSAAAASSAGGFVVAVREIVARLHLADQAMKLPQDRMVASELRALASLEEVLAEWEAERPPSATWEESLRLLNKLLRVATVPPARGEELVSVLDVLDARSVRFDRVYLMGLNEKAFPQLSSERCFIDEADRAAWSSRGLRLDRRSDLLGREMLLFYLACTRAGQFVQLSYATSDSSGASRSPSTFIEEFTQACRFAGRKVVSVRLPPGEIVPPLSAIACHQDVLNAAMFNAFDRDGDSQLAGALLAGLARDEGQRLLRACHGVLATQRRWSEGSVDEFDGRLNEPAALAMLSERLKSWVFSASEFNSFAICPWQFLARYVLHLEELPEPSASLSPQERGSFFHAVLWRVMTALRQAQGEFVELDKVEEAELLTVLEQAVEAERSRMAPLAAYAELWRIETTHWARQLAQYLLAERKKTGRKGAFFELGFGLGSRSSKRSDPASRKQAVEIDLGGRSVLLAGKIDRVDIDSAGRSVIVDYKSGSPPSLADLIAGLDLQLGLYAVAMEKLLDKPCAGGEYHGLRKLKYTYFRQDKLSPCRSRPQDKLYAQLLQELLATARQYLQAMEEGRFDALPAGDCPAMCPYNCICQFSQTRRQRKSGGHQVATGEEGEDE